MSEMKAFGVYAIVNLCNQKLYVGSTTTSFHRRWLSHQRLLRQGRHENSILQRAWNKYGPDSFDIVILETCSKVEDVLTAEQKAIDVFQVCDRAYGYNIRKDAVNARGHVRSEAHRRVISSYMKTLASQPGFSERMRQIARIFFNDKDAVAARGRRLSDKYKTDDALRKRASEKAIQQHLNNPDQAKKHSAFMKARCQDGDVRAKQCQLLEKNRTDPEVQARLRANHAAAVADPAHRARVSEACKERWKDPVYRKRMLEKLTESRKRRHAKPALSR